MRRSTTFILALSLLAIAAGNARSPYINKVYAYHPAPGQFINELPRYETGDTQEDMNRKAEESIAGGDNNAPVSLGGYGGYLIFGFDHPVVNVPGAYDFKVWGNAFAAAINPDEDETRFGGSCEPGIVMVAYDANGNGVPDDAWYELAGSEYNQPETIKNYALTYHKPDEDKIKEPMPGYPYINDTSYIKWESNQGDKGYLYRNTFHSQPYYPQWISDETLVFEGTKLADNYVDESGDGSYYVQYAYDWGYADNFPNSDERSNFNIEWAVDASGASVDLPAVHFIKVYTAVNQYCGWLGETSTEVSGAEDLHPSAEIETGIGQRKADKTFHLLRNPVQERLIVVSDKRQRLAVYDYLGRRQLSFVVESGENDIPCRPLPQGWYALTNGETSIRFAWRNEK